VASTASQAKSYKGTPPKENEHGMEGDTGVIKAGYDQAYDYPPNPPPGEAAYGAVNSSTGRYWATSAAAY
jgi:hypothetical protein